jgi:predicted porin
MAPGVPKSFQLQDPVQINASAAYIIGTKGLISVEYDYINYTGTKFLSIDNQDYTNVNDGMKQTLNDVRTIKIGGEYKLTNNFSLRAGYANTNNGTKADAEKFLDPNTKRVDTEYFLHNSTNYFTLGFGYRESNWFIDFAYMNKVVDETFYAYNTNNLVKELLLNATTPTQVNYARSLAINPASVITSTNNAVITLGFKF